MKIIASDFDGTFNYGDVTEGKISAVARWQAAGNKLGVVSGRGIDAPQRLKQAYPTLSFDFFALCNGAYITDGDGKLLCHTVCKEISALDLSALLFAYGCKYIHLYSDTYTCLVNDYEDIPFNATREQSCLFKDFSGVDKFYQISIAFPTKEEAALVVQKLLKDYGDKINPLQNGRCIDIVPAGVNKAEGVYRAMEFFGCSRDDVITVGDNINDIDMLREFRSYAMRNGVSEAQAIADGIVSDVTEIIEKEL